jgi:hypothetical protein
VKHLSGIEDLQEPFLLHAEEVDFLLPQFQHPSHQLGRLDIVVATLEHECLGTAPQRLLLTGQRPTFFVTAPHRLTERFRLLVRQAELFLHHDSRSLSDPLFELSAIRSLSTPSPTRAAALRFERGDDQK